MCEILQKTKNVLDCYTTILTIRRKTEEVITSYEQRGVPPPVKYVHSTGAVYNNARQ